MKRGVALLYIDLIKGVKYKQKAAVLTSNRDLDAANKAAIAMRAALMEEYLPFITALNKIIDIDLEFDKEGKIIEKGNPRHDVFFKACVKAFTVKFKK